MFRSSTCATRKFRESTCTKRYTFEIRLKLSITWNDSEIFLQRLRWDFFKNENSILLNKINQETLITTRCYLDNRTGIELNLFADWYVIFLDHCSIIYI